MAKIVFIVGSPRNNGSSSIIADKIIQGINHSNKGFGEIKKYCLGDLELNYCQGCKSCYEAGKCIINDDFQDVFNQIKDSDYVVIISPSYWGDITGQIKVFFDRSTPYCNTNPQRNYPEKKRRGISIAIRTGLNEMENTHIIETIEHYFGHLEIIPVEKLSVCGVENPSNLMKKTETLKKAYDIGVNIADGIYV